MDQHYSAYRMLLETFYLASLLAGGFLALKIISLYGVPMTGSAVLFPFAIVLVTITGEVYGYDSAKRNSYAAVVACLFVAVAAWLVGVLPDGLPWKGEDAVHVLEPLTPRFIGVTALGYLLAQHLCFRFLQSAGRKSLYVRLVGAPVVSQMVAAMVIVPGYYYGYLDTGHLVGLTLNRVAFAALFMSALMAPMFKAIDWLRSREKSRAVARASRNAQVFTSAQRDYLVQLSDALTDGIISINDKSEIIYVNPAFCAMLGYAIYELTGKSLERIAPLECWREHTAGFKRFLETGKKTVPWSRHHVTLRTRQGEPLQVHIYFLEVQIDDTRIFSGIVNREEVRHVARRAAERAAERP